MRACSHSQSRSPKHGSKAAEPPSLSSQTVAPRSHSGSCTIFRLRRCRTCRPHSMRRSHFGAIAVRAILARIGAAGSRCASATSTLACPGAAARVAAAARAAGEAGLVVVDDEGFTIEPPRWREAYARKVTLPGGPQPAPLPIIRLHAAAFARHRSRAARRCHVLGAGAASRPLPAFDIPVRLQATRKLSHRDFGSNNILGMLPGTDPRLAPQVVFVSAHLVVTATASLSRAMAFITARSTMRPMSPRSSASPKRAPGTALRAACCSRPSRARIRACSADAGSSRTLQ